MSKEAEDDLRARIAQLQEQARVLMESRKRAAVLAFKLRAENATLLKEMNALELELVAVKHDMERLRRGEFG